MVHAEKLNWHAYIVMIVKCFIQNFSYTTFLYFVKEFHTCAVKNETNIAFKKVHTLFVCLSAYIWQIWHKNPRSASSPCLYWSYWLFCWPQKVKDRPCNKHTNYLDHTLHVWKTSFCPIVFYQYDITNETLHPGEGVTIVEGRRLV